MDTVLTAVNVTKPSCYMVSIDLKDVYYKGLASIFKRGGKGGGGGR